jgi:AraC family transcriptional regulator, ethanolamine operon transcriptional activator
MASFTDGIVVQRDFDDFDAIAASTPAWALEFARTDAGPFAARLDLAMTAEMQILRLTAANGLVGMGMTPSGASGIGLLHSVSSHFKSLGRSIDAAVTTPARLEQSEVHFVSDGPIDLMVITFDQPLFERHLETKMRKDASKFGTDWLVRVLPGTPSFQERACAMDGLLSALSSDAITSPAAKHRLQECALHILFDGLVTDAGSAPVASCSTRRRVARAAEEVLRQRLDDPPSLSELCHALNVPERTLNAAFHEGFGMAPKAYLRALRLSAAHMRLRCGKGSVTEAATDLGFFHFGRFAGEYRAMFGEPPSETLRRALGMGSI